MVDSLVGSSLTRGAYSTLLGYGGRSFVGVTQSEPLGLPMATWTMLWLIFCILVQRTTCWMFENRNCRPLMFSKCVWAVEATAMYFLPSLLWNHGCNQGQEVKKHHWPLLGVQPMAVAAAAMSSF